jgi:hypothetical protein
MNAALSLPVALIKEVNLGVRNIDVDIIDLLQHYK